MSDNDGRKDWEPPDPHIERLQKMHDANVRLSKDLEASNQLRHAEMQEVMDRMVEIAQTTKDESTKRHEEDRAERKARERRSVWGGFGMAALGHHATVLDDENPPKVAADAAKYADAMMVEWEKRNP